MSFITLELVAPRDIGPEDSVEGYLDSLFFDVTIQVADGSYSSDREPALDFLRAYHAALIGSMALGMPSMCHLFSDDVGIKMVPEPGGADSMKVTLVVARVPVASSLVSRREAADVFRLAVAKILGPTRGRFSYADVVRQLSSPMIPENEAFLPIFLARDSAEGADSAASDG